MTDEVPRDGAAHAGGGADHVFGDRSDPDYESPVYVISVAAELADMHPQTLRAYERKGLIRPARTEGGTRRYSRAEVDRLRFIQVLTQERGLNLAGVQAVMEMGEQLQSARRRIGELEEMVRTLATRVEARPAEGDGRFQLVKAPAREVEVHPTVKRRTASGSGVRQAKVRRPPAGFLERQTG